MKQAIYDLLEQLLEGSGLSPDDLLWGILAAVLVFAVIHLLTMLVTKWGDRQATTKAFIFSMSIHGSILVYILFLLHVQAVDPAQADDDKRKRTLVRNFIDEPRKKPDPVLGNTPVWERRPDPVQEQVARLTPEPVELIKPDAPERKVNPQERPDVHLPDLVHKPTEPVAVPQNQNRPQAGPMRREASPNIRVDDPNAEARTDLSVPTPSNRRTTVDRTGQAPVPEVQRSPRQGSVDRVRSKFDPLQSQVASLNLPRPNSLPRRGPVDDVVRRRTGPAPAPAPSDNPGLATANPEAGSQSGSRRPTRTNRIPARSPGGTDNGGIERFRPNEIATAPGGLRRPAEPAFRTGADVRLPLPGPRLNVGRPTVSTVRKRPVTRLPATFLVRDRDKRKETVKKLGGTDESERAVELSLKWLADNQHRLGYWDADSHGAGRNQFRDETIDRTDPDRQWAGLKADSGLTGLSVLAFLAAGYTRDEGEYAGTIDRAILWLLRQQRADGYLGGQATYYARNYCHAMATYALAEAYAISLADGTGGDRRLRKPVENAVGYILEMQNPSDGGWRYRPGVASDMSMFGWQLMALKTAEIAGIPIPKANKDLMIQFLKDRSRGENNGLAGYRRNDQPSQPMTAEALFCKQVLGLNRDNPASKEAVDFVMTRMPKTSDTNLYYWYYGTLAMFQYGGEPWKKWNVAFRDTLRDDQEKTGPNAGSWNPDRDEEWGRFGGRVYSTAVATLCLQVYTRYLRLYGSDGELDE